MISRKLTLSFTLVPTIGFAVILAGCAYSRSGPKNQGWLKDERTSWYAATQGSRLLPYAWFNALEQPGSEKPFKESKWLESFGYIAADAALADRLPVGFAERADLLPVGFAVDQQPDEALTISKLRWYKEQTGKTKNEAERWLGLNCAACHTGEVSYQNKPIRIDGGPGLGDLQSFTDALDNALRETRDQPLKWERFAGRVLATTVAVQSGAARSSDTPENRILLKAALSRLISWEEQAAQMNGDTKSDRLLYGLARVDAFGHIYNKVAQFSGAPDPIYNPANAPVSYPFLWNIWRQSKVQWNGIVRNDRVKLWFSRTIEYGALGRNAGEVVGVFGDLILTPPPISGKGSLRGYNSSLRIDNLNDMERLVKYLEPPKWPDAFPAVKPALAARGQTLFGQHCASCHTPQNLWVKDEPIEKMLAFRSMGLKNTTDVWMACNAWAYQARSGVLAGTPADVIKGDPIPDIAPVSNLLQTTVKGALFAKKEDLIKVVVGDFFGAHKLPRVDGGPEDALSDDEKHAAQEVRCRTADSPLLAYKSRPLDGIWATAPYLHNGSVPTLYHLLLPANERPEKFWLGSRNYDPKFVGYQWDIKPVGRSFLFQTVDAAKKPIRGNSKVGHEYGVDMSDQDRWALVEYMKTL
jgi:hypothetical protein